MSNKTISVVLPCLNESKSISTSVSAILRELKLLEQKGYSGEIIIVDNNSVDNSLAIAKKMRVKVLVEKEQGYGRVLRTGFENAKGDFIIMVDCDNSYDYSKIPTLVASFEKGYDFVLASRFLGSIEKGAMPFLNRYIGNPLLTFALNWVLGSRITDSQTGMRGLRRNILQKCQFTTNGFEFASELIIEMINNGARLAEIPVNYKSRIGKSNLNPFIDGFRHLFLIASKL